MEQSFRTGSLPHEWKEAVVTPIYKKGDKLVAANYRPISLTSIICKAMEKIIVTKIREFLSKKQVITDEQHGFVPRRSTVTNLLLCLDYWTANWNDRVPTDVVYLDYEKAFDRVPIKRLVSKLQHFGIRGNLLMWIENFLSDRTFRVRVGNDLSDSYNVLSGVPQGSVLGPILFCVYLTDLKVIIKSGLSLFADDTKIMGNPLISHNIIQEDLNRIFEWTQNWLITLNPGKCTVLHVGNNNPKLPYSINMQTLDPVTTQRDLGVAISTDLKWETHILSITEIL